MGIAILAGILVFFGMACICGMVKVESDSNDTRNLF